MESRLRFTRWLCVRANKKVKEATTSDHVFFIDLERRFHRHRYLAKSNYILSAGSECVFHFSFTANFLSEVHLEGAP